MSAFSTTFLLAVLFGVSTLVGFALKRFDQHAVDLPSEIMRLKLSPRLLTQPERYHVGLALYVGSIVGIYLLLTLFPEALLALLSETSPSTGEAIVVGSAHGASFPLAVAALMTSAQFLGYVSEPERILRLWAQKVAGVPDDVGFVLDLIRTSDWPDWQKLNDGGNRLGISKAAMEMINPKGSPAPEAAVDTENPTEGQWRRCALRGIQYGSLLADIRSAQIGTHASPLVRSQYWQQFDFALFDNFWALANERIELLRRTLNQVRYARQGGQSNDRVSEPIDNDREPTEVGEGLERVLTSIQLELSAILAAAVSTGGTANFKKIVDVLDLFPADRKYSPRGQSLPPRQRLLLLRAIGVETRSVVVKHIAILCVALVAVSSLISLLPRETLARAISVASIVSTKSVETRFNRDRVEKSDKYEDLCRAYRDSSTDVTRTILDYSYSSMPAYPSMPDAFKRVLFYSSERYDGIRSLVSELCEFKLQDPESYFVVAHVVAWTLAIGFACALGFRVAYKRRNEVIARELLIAQKPLPNGVEHVAAIAGSNCAESKESQGTGTPASSQTDRLELEPAGMLMQVERFLLLFRLAFPAGLLAAVIILGPVVLNLLTRADEYTTAAQQFAHDCTSILTGSAFAVAGADSYILLSALAVLVVLFVGACLPAAVVAFGIAAAESWSRRSRGGTEGRRSRTRRFAKLSFLVSVTALLPFGLTTGSNLLFETVYTLGGESLLIVKSPVGTLKEDEKSLGQGQTSDIKKDDKKREEKANGGGNAASKDDPASAGGVCASGDESGASDPAGGSYLLRRYSHLRNNMFGADKCSCESVRAALKGRDERAALKFVEWERTFDVKNKANRTIGDVKATSGKGKTQAEADAERKASVEAADAKVEKFKSAVQSAVRPELGIVVNAFQLSVIYCAMLLTIFYGIVLTERRVKRAARNLASV